MGGILPFLGFFVNKIEKGAINDLFLHIKRLNTKHKNADKRV